MSAPAAEQLPAGPPVVETPPPADKAPSSARSGHAKRKRAKSKAAGGAKAPSTGAVLNGELKKLEEQLTALLVMPAVPMHMAGDEWAGAHVEARGPELAHQVVELARRNPAFRAQLQKLLAVNEGAQLGMAAAAYLIPLLIYYGFLPTPPILREQLKVPDRAAARVYAQPDYAAPVGSDDGSTQARPGAFAERPPGAASAAAAGSTPPG